MFTSHCNQRISFQFVTMASRSNVVIIYLFVLLIACADAECPADRQGAYHDEGRLHDDLLCAYRSDYRPVKDHKSVVTVKIRFVLKYISFDALEETFTIHSYVAMSWKDEFLKWTPSDYGDIQEIQIESYEIWTPRMSLFNANAPFYPSDFFNTTCFLSYDGTVTCVPHIAHSGICATSLRRWPYDSQNCTLYFGSWMHTGEQVNFTFYKTRAVFLGDYQNGPGWKLLNVINERLPGKFGKTNTTYPMLRYIFMLRREAAGPAAIVVIPSCVIVMLTLTSLLLDVKDNTRLVLACFSLFGHYVFITEIGYNMPKHSSDTPILLMFVRDSMIVTLVVILETLMVMALRQKTVPAPTWIVRVNRLVNSGFGKYVVFTEFDPSDITDEKSLTDDPVCVSDQRSREVSDWIKFANLLNSCLFIISVLVYIILISTYIPIDDE